MSLLFQEIHINLLTKMSSLKLKNTDENGNWFFGAAQLTMSMKWPHTLSISSAPSGDVILLQDLLMLKCHSSVPLIFKNSLRLFTVQVAAAVFPASMINKRWPAVQLAPSLWECSRCWWPLTRANFVWQYHFLLLSLFRHIWYVHFTRSQVGGNKSKYILFLIVCPICNYLQCIITLSWLTKRSKWIISRSDACFLRGSSSKNAEIFVWEA